MGALGRKLGWRRPDGVAPGSDLTAVEQLDLIDITLITDIGGRSHSVPHLALHFDANGLNVRRSDGSSAVQIPWVSLRRLQTSVHKAKGSTADVALDVESDRKRHHFLIPNVHPDALKGSLGAMSARYAHLGLTDEAPRKSFRLR
ncbi:MAG: hypothetical protein ACLQK4_04900 [Acidimicrobiales bacterium]|jgi:hypothetical protein